jgi:hypothetical protein
MEQAVATANTWTARALPMRVACPNGDTVGAGDAAQSVGEPAGLGGVHLGAAVWSVAELDDVTQLYSLPYRADRLAGALGPRSAQRAWRRIGRC